MTPEVSNEPVHSTCAHDRDNDPESLRHLRLRKRVQHPHPHLLTSQYGLLVLSGVWLAIMHVQVFIGVDGLPRNPFEPNKTRKEQMYKQMWLSRLKVALQHNGSVFNVSSPDDGEGEGATTLPPNLTPSITPPPRPRVVSYAPFFVTANTSGIGECCCVCLT